MLTNITNSTTSFNPDDKLIVAITVLFQKYVNEVTGLIGVFVNLFIVIVLTDRKLKHKIYDFFLVRQITNLIACVFVVIYKEHCFGCLKNTAWIVYYTYHIGIMIRVSILASFVSEILLIFNRYFYIISRQIFLSRISKKLSLFICYTFSFSLALPVFFSISVVEDSSSLTFYSELNSFGSSIYFRIYTFFLILFESFLPLFILFLMNILSVIKFKNLMTHHAEVSGNRRTSRKAEYRFTKMVLLLTSITFIVRLIDLITMIFNRIYITSTIKFDTKTVEYIRFFKGVSVLTTNLGLALDAIVILKMDKNIWNIILTCFKFKKLKCFKISLLVICFK